MNSNWLGWWIISSRVFIKTDRWAASASLAFSCITIRETPSRARFLWTTEGEKRRPVTFNRASTYSSKHKRGLSLTIPLKVFKCVLSNAAEPWTIEHPDCFRRASKKANSIVVLDNVSVHNDPEVQRLIKSVGTELVMGEPYSPDLNPMEKMFSVYKAYICREFFSNKHWYEVHEEALAVVTPEIAFDEFRHCGVPMGDSESPCQNNASIINTC